MVPETKMATTTIFQFKFFKMIILQKKNIVMYFLTKSTNFIKQWRMNQKGWVYQNIACS
jgi:hypothetical protein